MVVYDAFISYSHSKDKPLARELQKVIQSLGRPWYKRRMARVFLDDTSLTATPSLWPTIVSALESSSYLILLASPEARASGWVNKEVEWWLANKEPETLLIALADGELNWNHATGDFWASQSLALPPAAMGRFATEPLWIDIREWRDERSRRSSPEFKAIISKLAGAVRGRPPEDLWSEELIQQKLNLRYAFSAAGLLLVLSLIATGTGIFAWQQRDEVIHLYFRQVETTARAHLRQGEFAKSVHDLAVVSESKRSGLTDRSRLNALLVGFSPLAELLKKQPPWSVLSWKNKMYIRGAGAKALYSISSVTDAMWLRHRHYLVIFNDKGRLVVFDTAAKSILSNETVRDRANVCDLRTQADGGLLIFGFGLDGATLASGFWTRWHISPTGSIQYRRDRFRTDEMRKLAACPNAEASKNFATTVQPTIQLLFPLRQDELQLWQSSVRSALSEKELTAYFSTSQADGVRYFWHDHRFLEIGRPDPAVPEELVKYLFCQTNCYVQPVSRVFGPVRVLFGQQFYVSAGESRSLCFRTMKTQQVSCAQVDFRYGNESFNGLRVSRDGKHAVLFGRGFEINRAWGQKEALKDWSLAIGRAPDFNQWQQPEGADKIGEILDASFDATTERIAVVAETGIYLYSLSPKIHLLQRYPRDGAISIGWIGENSIAYISDTGLLTAFSLDQVQPWPPMSLTNLPYKKNKDGTGKNQWWLSANAKEKLILIGNGHSEVVVDGHLGAPLTGPLTLNMDIGLFAKPIISLAPDGAMSISARWSTHHRKPLQNSVPFSTLVGSKGGVENELRDILQERNSRPANRIR